MLSIPERPKREKYNRMHVAEENQFDEDLKNDVSDEENDRASDIGDEASDDYDDQEDEEIEGSDVESDEVDNEEEEEEDDDDQKEEGDYDEEEDDGEEDNEDEQKVHQKNAEMEELEKEYMDLQNMEQNLVQNLKRHKDDDLLKGRAMRNQKALWDKNLEFRILLQKAFSKSNRLPQEPVRSAFCNFDGVSLAYSDLIASCTKSIDSFLELQKALLENNPSITQAAEGDSGLSVKQSELCNSSDLDDDEEWPKISQMQARIATFRNKSVDKWHRKNEVSTGVAVKKGKLHAFNQNVSDQVASYMRDPSKMIKSMLTRKEAVGVFGSVPGLPDDTKGEEANVDGDPNLLDDTEFYQQLFKEFFETIDPNSSEAAFYAIKRLQTKKRKIVDRRASKSRKIRYNVHEKIVNFMAPQPVDLPPMAPKLFENLFGLKTFKPTA